MDWQGISEIARAQAGAKEHTTNGTLRWTINGRLIARRQDEQSLVVRIDFARREELLAKHPEALFVPLRFDAHQKVVVRIDTADDELVRTLIYEAWLLQTV